MAKIFNFLLCIILSVVLLNVSTQANLDVSPLEGNYTHVCDPSRYASLGLDMSDFGFCDSSLPYPVRVKDLVDRMTVAEKVQQMGDRAQGVARLGLPNYTWWSEALHGVSDVGHRTFFDEVVPGATSFPTVILTTASFNESLWNKIGQVVSTEARAMYNLGRAGLTFWSPNVNVVRDPRWGRITETPGEDPFVVGRYAANYVRGLQDVEGSENYTDLNTRPLKISSCCKHYTAYDIENWFGVDRFHFDSRVSEQDMVETFLRPFEMCVKEGDVSSVMCSFNRVNGIPTCADPKLLNQTVRGDWNLHGYIVSDCDSIQVIVDNQKYIDDTKEDAVAQAFKAGLDLDCGIYYHNFTVNAMQQGKVREDDIDRSLKYLYTVLMRVGWFDGNPKYMSLGKNDICSDEHIELAAEAAREGVVLLKNSNTLPLSPSKFRTLAVVGPHANATEAMIGNYAGTPCRYVAPIDGFSTYGKVDYQMGCGDVFCKNESLIYPAMRAAKKADATIVLVGLANAIESEGVDRTDLLLPGYQTQLIKQVAQVAKGPVILVVMCAGGVDISFAKDIEQIKGIFWAGQPGEQGGRVIADVVFGKYNPGGRLPLTWYKNNYIDTFPMTSMQLRPIDSLGYPGRTYKFFNSSTVYPFGYGLSYTNFTYSVPNSNRLINVKLNKFHHCHDLNYSSGAYRAPCPSMKVDDLECNQIFNFDVEVQNVGKIDGSEVIMVYAIPPKGILDSPIKQVIGFQRVFVLAGKSTKAQFKFNACKSLHIVDSGANIVLPSGSHTILLGDSGVSFPVQVKFS